MGRKHISNASYRNQEKHTTGTHQQYLDKTPVPKVEPLRGDMPHNTQSELLLMAALFSTMRSTDLNNSTSNPKLIGNQTDIAISHNDHQISHVNNSTSTPSLLPAVSLGSTNSSFSSERIGDPPAGQEMVLSRGKRDSDNMYFKQAFNVGNCCFKTWFYWDNDKLHHCGKSIEVKGSCHEITDYLIGIEYTYACHKNSNYIRFSLGNVVIRF